MIHEGFMVFEVAFLLMTSLFFALGFAWLGQPPLLGYIAAGIMLGPAFVKLIEYSFFVQILGHMGMLMLLFIVGLELDVFEFKKIWKRALYCVFLQLVTSTPIACILKIIFGFNIQLTVLIIFLITFSSTAVAVKLLEEMKELNSSKGSLSVSILIAQDLVLIPVILILKGFSETNVANLIAVKLIVSAGFLFVLIKQLSKESNKIFNPLKSIFQGSQETMTLAGVSVCFCFAAISSVLGLSQAYGSFLAGLILGSFGNRNEIIQFAMPVSSMLIMMFFLSVGSSLKVDFLLLHWKSLLITSIMIIIGKTFMNYVILRIIGCAKEKSMFIATILSQLSEFSFTLIAILVQSNFVDFETQNFLNSLVVLSLTFGSIWPVIGKHLFGRKMA
jgi:CPA2 family monovalent cation:H+ antiporter-2